MKRSLLIAAIVAGFAVPSGTALATDANGNHDTYFWAVGATTPSDTAVAPDGSTITMSGHGTFNAGPGGTASGGGTFTTSSGASGTWTASDIQGFVNYGQTPGFPVPGAAGGEAKLKVSLSTGQTGVLTITCLLGSPPPSKEEGITLILGAGVGAEYTKPVHESGNTVFIAS
jgi:hypothetical protein